MALEAVADQLKEQAQNIWSRIQENPQFNTLREKYEALSPIQQRLIISGTILLFIWMFLMIPMGYHTTSTEIDSEFDSKRTLLRQLLKAKRTADDPEGNIRTLGFGDLQSQINGILNTFNLVPEQVKGIKQGPSAPNDTNLAISIENKDGARDLEAEVALVELGQLNLKQVREIGFALQDIAPGVKLSGLEMTATQKDPHYFDTVYRLVTFRLKNQPEEAVGKGEAVPNGRGGGNVEAPAPVEDEEAEED